MKKSKGFTVVELLTVFAILVILGAIIAPASQRAAKEIDKPHLIEDNKTQQHEKLL